MSGKGFERRLADCSRTGPSVTVAGESAPRERLLAADGLPGLPGSGSSLTWRWHSFEDRAAHARADAEAMLDAIRLGHEGVLCVMIGRGLALLREGPRTAGLARDRPPTCERHRQAVHMWRAF